MAEEGFPFGSIQYCGFWDATVDLRSRDLRVRVLLSK
jgi:hypothetical protein